MGDAEDCLYVSCAILFILLQYIPSKDSLDSFELFCYQNQQSLQRKGQNLVRITCFVGTETVLCQRARI